MRAVGTMSRIFETVISKYISENNQTTFVAFQIKILIVISIYLATKKLIFCYEYISNYKKRNWVLATNLDFLNPISLQFNVGDLWYFKLWILLDVDSLKYWRFTPSGCKDIGIRKSELVAKTQFLYTSV